MQISYCLSHFSSTLLVDDPKLENDIIAITSTPNILAVFAVMMAILAKSSADGLMFMAVSDKNIGPRAVIMFVVATIEAPCAFQ
jgi:hypothetical protein